jgi:hypothetical protein
MTKLTCAVLILAACSKAKEPDPAPKAVEPTPTTPAPTPSTPPAPSTAKKDAPACPQGDALAAKIAKLYGVATVTDAVCAAGHFPQPAWMVHARYDSKDPDDGMVTERLALNVERALEHRSRLGKLAELDKHAAEIGERERRAGVDLAERLLLDG